VRRRTQRRGISSVEFALSLPLMLVMLSMIADGCIAMLYKHALSRAVRDGARVASSVSEPLPATGNTIEEAASKFTLESLENSGIDLSTVVVSSEWITSGQLARVEVIAGIAYEPILGAWSPFDQVLVQRFTMITVEQP
jgi:Flp pilus assembly protein TadG